MPPRVRVFQHVPHEGLGAMESVFAGAGAGAEIETTRFFEGEKPPALDSFDLLVVMGGPMGVYDETEFPWLIGEKRALQSALKAGKSVLGICLGSQLMAEVLGAKVTKNGHREIGWWPVEKLPGAHVSWVAHCFPPRFSAFHWHGDTFGIPPGAVPLFRSKGCANQGFAWGEKAVALQFHPEITPEIAATWLETGASELQPGPYVQTPEQIQGRAEDYESNHGWLKDVCRELIRRQGCT